MLLDIQLGVVTILAIIAPICVGDGEVGLAEAGHERDLPHNCFRPRADCKDVQVALLRIASFGDEVNSELLRLEAISIQVIQVSRLEVRTLFREPGSLFLG